jgi:gliding motility-associated-like protein
MQKINMYNRYHHCSILRLSFLFSLFLIKFSGIAQISFNPPVEIKVGYCPLIVCVGDVNNDGLKDVIVGSEFDNKIYVFIQDNNGNLKLPVSYNFLNYQISSIYIEDVNNDGLNDLVVSGGTNQIFYQNKKGTLDSAKSIICNTCGQLTGVGDVNNDGLNDLIINVINSLDTMTTVLYQNIDGKFIEKRYPFFNHGDWKVAIGDINNDGLNDIVSATFNKIYISTQNKNGELNSYQAFIYSNETVTNAGIKIGDINNDGLNDIILNVDYSRIAWEGNVLFFLQDAATNTIKMPIENNLGIQDPEGLDLSDLNCDGFLDAVSSTTDYITIRNLNNRNSKVLNSKYNQNLNMSGLSIGDINNDGKDDIVEASEARLQSIYIYYNTSKMDTLCCIKPPRIDKPIGDSTVCPLGTISTYYNKSIVQDSVKWIISPIESGDIIFSTKDSCIVKWNDKWNGVAKVYVRLINACGVWTNSLVRGVVVREPKYELGKDTTYCIYTSTTLDAYCEKCTSYLWQDGTTTPKYIVNKSELYTVSVTNDCKVKIDSIQIRFAVIPKIHIPYDTIVCNSNYVTFNAYDPGIIQYVWLDNSTKPSFSASVSGFYIVTLTDSLHCSSSYGVTADFKKTPQISMPKDTTFCDSVNLSIKLTDLSAFYLWNDGSYFVNYDIHDTGIYTVTATNTCGIAVQSIAVSKNESKDIKFTTDTILCSGKSIILDLKIAGTYKYLWQDNSTSPNYTVSKDGIYTVLVTDSNNCKSSKTITVEELAEPQIKLPKDTIVCNEIALPIEIDCSHCNYLWQDGNTSSKYTIQNQGIYTVVATNECGVAKDSISVKIKDCTNYLNLPNAFSPNDDGVNDVLYVVGRNVENINFVIYDRWGQMVFKSNNLADGWDGTFKGKVLGIGTYMYNITAISSIDKSKIEKKGSVSIIK